MAGAKYLTETVNFRPEVLQAGTAAETGSLFRMSEEFMLLAKHALYHSGFLHMHKYNAGVFCLGHSLELTYKALLCKDSTQYPSTHNFVKLYELMPEKTRESIRDIARAEGWKSCHEFHAYMEREVDFVNRKYYEAHSGFDYWTQDKTGQNIGHKLWPRLVGLCDNLRDCAAQTIWIYPTLPYP